MQYYHFVVVPYRSTDRHKQLKIILKSELNINIKYAEMLCKFLSARM